MAQVRHWEQRGGMNRKFGITIGIALTGFVLGISFFVWTIVTTSRMNICVVCKRHVPAATRTTVEVDGLKTILCCPVCALRWARRKDKKVVTTGVTDYETGRLIDPRSAYAVIGSDVNPSLEEEARSGVPERPAGIATAPCSPSMISFATLEAAKHFQAKHGGKLSPGGHAFALGPQRSVKEPEEPSAGSGQ